MSILLIQKSVDRHLKLRTFEFRQGKQGIMYLKCISKYCTQRIKLNKIQLETDANHPQAVYEM